MPNVHAPDKEMLGFYVPRILSRRVRKAAKGQKQSITAYIEAVLTEATKAIELTTDDYDQINTVIELKAHKQNQQRASLKAPRLAEKM
ncbi:MAG: hypothetical protein ACYC67_08705 [Prosthecobacter sp.]